MTGLGGSIWSIPTSAARGSEITEIMMQDNRDYDAKLKAANRALDQLQKENDGWISTRKPADA